ncbi:MAG: hypothetical protein GEEBNDBF_02626 [bacterium]|nr:hypothetical protein [bacterium]
MMFDRATANDSDTGDYLNVAADAFPLQQRNAVTSFKHIDKFVNICLTDLAITPFIAGFFIFDEPDIPRRLPQEAPEIVGLLAGKVVMSEECAFRVVSTNRPTEWSWQFFINGVEVTDAGGTVAFGATFEPKVRFPFAGRAIVKVRAGNWWGAGREYQFHFDALETAGPVAPVITGHYSRTTEGVVRGIALEKSDDDPQSDVTLEWTPAGSVFGAVGQDGFLGYCAVHASEEVISTFSVPHEELAFHESDWTIDDRAFMSDRSSNETAKLSFPPYTGDLNNASGHTTVERCSVKVGSGADIVTQNLRLVIQRQRINPYPSWIRPGEETPGSWSS